MKCDSSDSEPSSPTLPVKSFDSKSLTDSYCKAVLASDQEMIKNCAIGNVFDHFRDDELRSFREHIDEDMDKATFMHTLENHILHSLLVLRYGEKGAKEQMELLWNSTSDESEVTTPTSPVESEVGTPTSLDTRSAVLEKQRDKEVERRLQEFSNSASIILLKLESEVSTPTSPVYTRPPGEKAFKEVRVLMDRIRGDLDSIAELVLCLHFDNVELKEQLKSSA